MPLSSAIFADEISTMQEIIQQICSKEKLGSVQNIRPIPGGSINLGFHLKTGTGQFFLKMNDQVPDDYFEIEHNSLQLLDRYARTPRVIGHGKQDSASYLILEWITPVSTHPTAIEDLAFSLAQLHRQTRQDFGLDHHTYVGSLFQRNSNHQRWTDFYREERILPLVKLAYDNELLTQENVTEFEGVIAKMDELIPVEKPSLLHGDLWNGNYILSGSKSYLIDPAIYYGHREMDLAMTQLFGAFPDRFYEVYQSSHPLQSNWESRVPVFQLYPLLVHLNLFGSNYYPQLKDALIKLR